MSDKYISIYINDADKYMLLASEQYRLGKRFIKIETNWNGLFRFFAYLTNDEKNRKQSIEHALQLTFNKYFSSISSSIKMRVDYPLCFYIYNEDVNNMRLY